MADSSRRGRHDTLRRVRAAVECYIQHHGRLRGLGFAPSSFEQRMIDRGGSLPTHTRGTVVPLPPRDAILVDRALTAMREDALRVESVEAVRLLRLVAIIVVSATVPGGVAARAMALRISERTWYRRQEEAIEELDMRIGRDLM